MTKVLALLVCALLAAQAPAWGQERGARGNDAQKQTFGPREREGRGEQRRERTEREGHRSGQRFTPAEREKLRQDLIDANRDLKRGR
jgi:hypothetical protein